ncbi:hypothetical protein [Mangrovivirga cuniculi]|uniref:Uncharacterized protein n=1 Tax=Mangrovivirga cuniculi TaxID=2715131 RepID=A0A4D7JI22_9BACT|nr:hypothetical protein [Mangrovivirga cuniculi]QCK15649.1 hypothetical protein DCC35_13300 [Mangrovivirga cuniculi]
MKYILLFLTCIFSVLTVSAQINPADSSVQVISYWNLNETQYYTIHEERMTLKDGDTSSYLIIKYDVAISVIDSSESAYLMSWNFENVESGPGNKENKIHDSMMKGLTFKYYTDEYGKLRKLINTKEVKANLIKKVDSLEKMNDIALSYQALSDRIEKNTREKINQFHEFHGSELIYKESYEFEAELLGFHTLEEEEAQVTTYVWLDDVDLEDYTYILQKEQQANEELIKKIFTQNSDQQPVYSTWTASRIHDSGWVIYSVREIEQKTSEYIKSEKTIIELD